MCLPASATRCPTTGPSALANARSTNQGSVPASSFSVAISAASPVAVTRAFQRVGSARNPGTSSGDR